MNSGIYEIVNTINGKRYVGSAVNFSARWKTHRLRLNRKDNTNRHLQASWSKHGANAFEFRKLLICSSVNLLMYEQLALDALRPEYNVRQIADSNLGVKHSVETRAKMARAKINNPNIFGHIPSPEKRAKLSSANMGKRPSTETRAKLSAARIGKPHPVSAQARERMTAAARSRNTDYMRTAEYRAARAEQMRGNKHRLGVPHSAETKAKLSASYRTLPRFSGKTHTAEARAKMSAKVKGIPLKPEHVAKIRASLKRFWWTP